MSTALQVHNDTPTAPALMPAPEEWKLMLHMAGTLVKSGMLPVAVKTPEAAVTIMLKGRELDIPAMQSFSHIHVIKGKPTCSAELMLAILARGGVTWTWLEDGEGETARIQFHRPGFGDCDGTFSLEQAKAAGLLSSNPVWKSYPANMLRARAISNGARMIAPDLLSGMSYTPEEMGAAVNAEGEPLETPAQVRTVASGENNRTHTEPDTASDSTELSDYQSFKDRCSERCSQLGKERCLEILKGYDLTSFKEVEPDDTTTQELILNDLDAAYENWQADQDAAATQA